jgi:hydroxyacylglutathione hydrolase
MLRGFIAGSVGPTTAIWGFQGSVNCRRIPTNFGKLWTPSRCASAAPSMRISPSLAIIGSFQFNLAGPMDCHVYALRGPKGVVLFDSGAGTHTDLLLSNLEYEFGTQNLETVIISHCHLDHCGGAAALRSRTGCRVVTSRQSRPILEIGDEESSGLRIAKLQGTYPPDFHFSPCPVDTSVEEGTKFEAGGLWFRSFHIRGHSPDSHCFLTEIDGRNCLFAGDVVFYGGILGVINIAGSGMEGYRSDLPKLRGLRVDGFFPGHGLFVLRDGQRHIEMAIDQLGKGFLPRQIGQET